MNNFLSIISRTALMFCLTVPATYGMEPGEDENSPPPPAAHSCANCLKKWDPQQQSYCVISYRPGNPNDSDDINCLLQLPVTRLDVCVPFPDRYLSQLPNLNSLKLSRSHQNNLNPLTNLVALELEWTTGVTCQELTNLKSLKVKNCGGFSNKNLHTLTALTELSINSASVTGQAVSNLSNLTSLHSWNCSGMTYDCLKSLRNLVSLKVYHPYKGRLHDTSANITPDQCDEIIFPNVLQRMRNDVRCQIMLLLLSKPKPESEK